MKKTMVVVAILATLAVTQAVPLYGSAETSAENTAENTIEVVPASSVGLIQPTGFHEAGLLQISPSSWVSSVKTAIGDRMADTVRLLWKLA